MISLDLKRAEVAIAAGRLDEAFGLLRTGKNIDHARGQQLKDKLIDGLLVRAQEHLELEHFSEARGDVQMAGQLGGRQTRIVQLRHAIDRAAPFRKQPDRPSATPDQAALGVVVSQSRAREERRVPKMRSMGSLLQVDQIGSLLLFTGEYFSIGSTETTGNPDIVLQTQGQSEAIYLRRSGEDYLASCGCGLKVNGKRVRETLLNNKDSIEVGTRGRLTFSRPVPASSTSVLEIKGSKMQRRDVRRIVLMGDALIFGTQGSHFYADVPQPIFVRSGSGVGLDQCGQDDESSGLIVHEKGDRSHQRLPFGDSVLVGSTRFSLASVTQGSGN